MMKELINEATLFFKQLNCTIKSFNNLPRGKYLNKHQVMVMLHWSESKLNNKKLSLEKQKLIKDGDMKLKKDINTYLMEGYHYYCNDGNTLYNKKRIMEMVENSQAILMPSI